MRWPCWRVMPGPRVCPTAGFSGEQTRLFFRGAGTDRCEVEACPRFRRYKPWAKGAAETQRLSPERPPVLQWHLAARGAGAARFDWWQMKTKACVYVYLIPLFHSIILNWLVFDTNYLHLFIYLFLPRELIVVQREREREREREWERRKTERFSCTATN